MIVPGSASPLLLSSAGGYNLTNSLRFRSSANAYLNRTFGSGNQQLFTYNLWVKRGSLGASRNIFSCGSSGTSYWQIRFNSDDTLLLASENGGSTLLYLNTTQVFRDPSAWYMLTFAIDTTQTTSTNRVKVYVNGVQVTAFSTANYPSQNTNFVANSAITHYIGDLAYSLTAQPFDGYITEVNFVNAQQLTPSSFGQTSATTGVWIPKKYTGTYGTNGFYLPFTDNSALTTSSNVGLGKDFSGNANYWTTNNISITSGSTYDSMTDVPTLTSATTANYCVVNPLPPSSSGGSWYTQDGNLKLVRNGSGFITAVATMGVTSGKWYWEVIPQNSGSQFTIGIAKDGYDWTTYLGSNAFGWSYEGGSGVKYTNGSSSAYGATYTTNDVIGVAFDADAGTLTFYKNNTSQGQAFSGLTSGPYYPASGVSNLNTAAVFNFGQRPFAYTPPTGFNRLNTFNLPTPTIGATASTTANKYMDVSLYTGNATARTITNSGSFQPDFVWIKNRSNGSFWHQLYDVNRGALKGLFSNDTSSESTYTDTLTAFASNGFTLGTDATFNGGVNKSGDAYVAWQWRANGTAVTNTAGSITSTVSANTSAGFSVVTYTGTGSNATVGHGLGIAPSMIIGKSRSQSGWWICYHQNMAASPATGYLALQLTNAFTTQSTVWNNTAPTSSVFSLGSAGDLNTNGATNVAYCFAQVAGYSAFGSYTGNGSSDGTFVYTGFRPRFIMFKVTTTTNIWIIHDTARDTYNVSGRTLIPNASDSEYSSNQNMDILSNGFKLRSSDSATNQSGQTFIYAAFAESPFRYANAR